MTINYEDDYDENDIDSSYSDSVDIIQDQEGGTIAFNSAELMSANFDGGIPKTVFPCKVKLTPEEVTAGTPKLLSAGDYIYWDFSTGTSPDPITSDEEDGEVEESGNTDDYDDVYLVTGVESNEEETEYYIYYMDDEEEKSITITTPSSTIINAVKEDWSNKELGTEGWLITSAGNAIFTNVAARGTIEANEGYLKDLDVTGTLRMVGTPTDEEDLVTGDDPTIPRFIYIQNPALSPKDQPSIVMNKNGFIVRSNVDGVPTKIMKVPLNGDNIYISGYVGDDGDDGDGGGKPPVNKDRIVLGGKNHNLTLDGGTGNKAIFTTIGGTKTDFDIAGSNGFIIQAKDLGNGNWKTRMKLQGSNGFMKFNGDDLIVSGEVIAKEGWLGDESNGWRIQNGALYTTTGTNQIYLISSRYAGSDRTAKITITSDAYLGDFPGTFNSARTPFYVDSTGLFSLSNQLSFTPSNGANTVISTTGAWNGTTPVITVGSTTGIKAGMTVLGQGIPVATYVVSVSTPNVTISKTPTPSASEVPLTFQANDMSLLRVEGRISGVIDPLSYIVIPRLRTTTTSITVSGTSPNQTATITTAGHAFAPNEKILIENLPTSIGTITGLNNLNREHIITSVTDSVTFTISLSGITGVSSGTGNTTAGNITLRELTMGLHPEQGYIITTLGATGTVGSTTITTTTTNLQVGMFVSRSGVIVPGSYITGIGTGTITINNPLLANLSGQITVKDNWYRSSGTGIQLDKYNFWLTNNQFRVGSVSSYLNWDGSLLSVRGDIQAESGFLSSLNINGILKVLGTALVGDDDQPDSTTIGAIHVKTTDTAASAQPSIVMNKNGLVIRALVDGQIKKIAKFPLNGNAVKITGYIDNDSSESGNDTPTSSDSKLVLGKKQNNLTLEGGTGNKSIFTTINNARTIFGDNPGTGETRDGFLIQTILDGGTWKSRMKLSGSGGTKFMKFDGNNLTVSGEVRSQNGVLGGDGVTANQGWLIDTNEISSNGTALSKIYLINDALNPKITISSNTLSKGAFVAADTPFYADSEGNFSLSDKLFFNIDKAGTQFGELTVIGRIKGAFENTPIASGDENIALIGSLNVFGTYPDQYAVINTVGFDGVTALANNYLVGDTVVIEGLTATSTGVDISSLNGAWVIVEKPTSTSFIIKSELQNPFNITNNTTTTPTVVNTSTTLNLVNGSTITLPTSTTTGDMCIIFVSSTGSTPATPSGWTSLDDTLFGTEYQRIFYRIFSTTPTAPTISGITGSSVAVAITLRGFSGVPRITTTSGSAINPDSPSTTTRYNNSLVLSFAAKDDSNYTPTVPTSYTGLTVATQVGQTAMLARRTITTAGIENPGPFGGGSLADDFIAHTVVIEPAITNYTSFTKVTSITLGSNLLSTSTNYDNIIAGQYIIRTGVPQGTTVTSVTDISGSIAGATSSILRVVMSQNATTTSTLTTNFLGSSKLRNAVIGLHPAKDGSPAGLGLRMDKNNYWFINNNFKVGTDKSYIKWNGSALEVTGEVIGSTFTIKNSSQVATRIPLFGKIIFRSIDLGNNLSTTYVEIDNSDGQINSLERFTEGVFRVQGSSNGMLFDANDIQVVAQASPPPGTAAAPGTGGDLRLQRFGGTLQVGSSGVTMSTTIFGSLVVNTTSPNLSTFNGNVTVNGTLSATTFNPSSLSVTNTITAGGQINATGLISTSNEFRAPNGTPGEPSYTFTNSDNTGLYLVMSGNEPRFNFTRKGNLQFQVMDPLNAAYSGRFNLVDNMELTFSNVQFASNTTTGYRQLIINPSSVNYTVATAGSTRRIKQDIVSVHNDIKNSRFLELEPVKYRYIKEVEEIGDEAGWDIGFIAEDAQDLGLEMLYQTDSDGIPDYFAYDKMPIYLFSIIKEQENRIKSLEERLALLEG